MPRRKRTRFTWKRLVLAVLAIPLLYLAAALVGSLIPVNRDWREPDQGITIYLVDNGVHLDLVLPAEAAGLSWRSDFAPKDIAEPRWANSDWVMIGAGERAVYLDTPTWADLSLKTAARAAITGEQIIHVQWASDPEDWADAAIRLTPEQYRRLHAAIRASFDLKAGRPQRIDHPGYWDSDAFYEGVGNFNAIRTCNQWVASRLRIAGVETSLWSPFSKGLPWRYRPPQPQ